MQVDTEVKYCSCINLAKFQRFPCNLISPDECLWLVGSWEILHNAVWNQHRGREMSSRAVKHFQRLFLSLEQTFVNEICWTYKLKLR